MNLLYCFIIFWVSIILLKLFNVIVHALYIWWQIIIFFFFANSIRCHIAHHLVSRYRIIYNHCLLPRCNIHWIILVLCKLVLDAFQALLVLAIVLIHVNPISFLRRDSNHHAWIAESVVYRLLHSVFLILDCAEVVILFINDIVLFSVFHHYCLELLNIRRVYLEWKSCKLLLR